nr:hypothetical protein [Tanacetum cinerariifolium]
MEKVDVTRGKGIKLLYEVALTEDAQSEEVQKKSLRDFHKTHPSGSGTVTKTAPRNDEDDSNNDNNSESDGIDEENDNDDENTQSDNKKGRISSMKLVKMYRVLNLIIRRMKKRLKMMKKKKRTSMLESHLTILLLMMKIKPMLSDNAEDIPTIEAEIVSPMDVPVHHEVPSGQTPTLLIIHVLVITESSVVYTINIPQSLQSFTPPPLLSTPTPPPTTEATNPQSALPDFASVFQFNNRVSALEKDVSELKKDDPLKTQVTALEPEFEVADSDMPQDQEENPGNDDEVPKRKVASKCDWFTKPKQPQEPTDPE